MPTRIDRGPRMSQAVIHGDTVYLAGQLGTAGRSVAEQTAEVLEKIETLLQRAGSSKDRLLSATIWLADINDFAEMNAVWDAWIADVGSPARATGESRLVTPGHKVEIIVVAARH